MQYINIQRPSAEELLKTRFIKNAPSSKSPLLELLAHYKLWKAKNSREEQPKDEIDSETIELPEDDGWIFDSIRNSQYSDSTMKKEHGWIFDSIHNSQSTIKKEPKTEPKDNIEKIDTIIKNVDEDIKSTLKPLKISESKKNPKIDWEAMIESANMILPASRSNLRSPVIPQRSSSTKAKQDSAEEKLERKEMSPLSLETRQYHFNSSDDKNSDNIRISWSSKKIVKTDGFTNTSDRAVSWNPLISPKPLNPSFFNARNQVILTEHNYRKEEFLRLLNSFFEQVEKL
jgi:hypothetical protein